MGSRPLLVGEAGRRCGLFGEVEGEGDGGDAEDDATDGVTAEGGKVAVLQQCERFAREGGECGETAAQSHGEKQVGAWRKAGMTARQSTDDADEQTTHDIHGEGAPREGTVGFHGDGHKVTQHAADEAASANK